MKILVFGPESSGTRVFADIVSTSGLQVQHRSLPHANDWEIPDADVKLGISRNPKCTIQSALHARHASDMEDAVIRLATAVALMHVQADLIIAYEDLVEDTDVTLNRVAAVIKEKTGLDAKFAVPPLVNMNEKYDEIERAARL